MRFLYHRRMRLTFNRFTALRILRAMRTGRFRDDAGINLAAPLSGKFADSEGSISRTTILPIDSCRRSSLIAPDPSPKTRWTRKQIDLSRFGLQTGIDATHPLDVAVPFAASRLQMRFARNSVYERENGLPAQSFIEVAEGLAISCPELIFVEMSSIMDLEHLVMLGYELCGMFARDADDARNGEVSMGVAPVTSVNRIASYLETAKWVRGAKQARFALGYIADNAWSPVESVVATVASLPIGGCGYEMGPVSLNARIFAPETLARVNSKGSRVPDILFKGTHVGLNYDGSEHFDLNAIVGAAVDAERNPDDAFAQVSLDNTVKSVRAKAVDDIRRNRELAASGYIVFPVTKEDLDEDGGLDRVMAQAMEAIEMFDHKDMSKQRRFLDAEFYRMKRQQLIWSLTTGMRENRIDTRRFWARMAGNQSRVIETEIDLDW